MAAFVVDTSALICVFGEEPDAEAFRLVLREADQIVISMGTVFESSCVARGNRFPDGENRFARLLAALDMEYAAFDNEQLDAARAGYARYGKGSGHPAALNMGDCFAYALAKTRGLPLLFKGDDFVHTDVVPALKPA
jgi:ribonuclease VapC